MEDKVIRCLERLKDVENLLASPGVFDDATEYRRLTKEHSYLSDIRTVYQNLLSIRRIREDDVKALSTEKDPEIVVMLEEEIKKNERLYESCEKTLLSLLVPPDPDDDLGVIMELRAGTGGDEAALFVADCVRMYQLFAMVRGWKCEVLAVHESDLGGFREYIMGFSGDGVKRFLQYEGGTHRVQRVPETETQGRVHTSAITIAILPEPSEEEDVKIDEKDLRIDTYRSSGAGGQHVNVTDSAVRITHLPTGAVAACQEERSQHKNKEKAMRILKAKIREAEAKKRSEIESALRSNQVGSGDRSERIRTYNFPQNRLTDHRINLTLYSLDKVLEGDLEPIVSALVRHFYQLKLAS
ncbi:MAG: peptide chain release factor 1 [Victivallaceae bacterium]